MIFLIYPFISHNHEIATVLEKISKNQGALGDVTMIMRQRAQPFNKQRHIIRQILTGIKQV
jgi:hypothetical protein